MRSLQSFPFTNATGGIKPIEAADPVCPVEFDPNVAAEHWRGRSNLDRFLLIPSINFSDSNESLRQWIASYPSSLSTCSTSQSDPFPTPRRIHGEMWPNMPKSSMPAGLEQHEPADTPVTAVSTGPELDTLSSLSLHRQTKAESESACLPGSVAHRHAVRQGDPTWSAEIRPLEDDIPLRLRLMEMASNQIHYQRLSESWDGLSFDVAKLINFEKRLWALSGLKRLNHLLRKGESLRDGPGLVANDGDATKRRQDGENVLYICEDGGMSCKPNDVCCLRNFASVVLTFYAYTAESWLQAATSHSSKIYCLLPSETQGLTAQWKSRPNVYTNYWADIPTLPYQDSFMDLISSRSIPLLLRSSQWPVFVQECVRVLRPGGVIELTILDPMPRNCGPLLRQWTARNLVLGLERRSLVTHPAMIIPLWLDDVADFGRRESMTFAYSATVDEDTHELRLTSEEVVRAHPQSDEADRRSGRDLQRLGTTVGRHFYQTLYNDLVPEVFQQQLGNFELEKPWDSIRHWWWKHPAIVRECKEQGTVFEMVTYKCCKKEPA